MISDRLVAVAPIPVGDHVKVNVFGLSFDADTIWSTLIACAAVFALGLYLRRHLTSGVPNKVQLFWEVLVGWVSDQVEVGLGPRYRHVVPLAVTIFMLVLAANWIEIFPAFWHNTDYLPSPSADVNLTYALGATVFVLTNGASIRAKGFGGYIKSFFAPPRWLAPIRALEELMKPVTLAMRLFGKDHGRAPAGDPDLLFPGNHRIQCGLEDVRPVHRYHPGLHFCPAYDPLLSVRSCQRGPLSPEHKKSEEN
jgi:F-type H+-transporting ATPase subunit a